MAASNARVRPRSCQHAIVRGDRESPFLPNHGFVTTAAVECLHCLESVSARKGIDKSHLLSACHAVGALVSLRRHKNASSGLVGSCREPGVGIAQASHGGRSIATQGRCDLVAKSCPSTIPLLLINRRHLNALDDWPPPKSSSPLRQPQTPRTIKALPFCITFVIAPVSLQLPERVPLGVPASARVENRPLDGPQRFGAVRTIFLSMPMPVSQSDYSVVVKLRAPPPNSWRWEIYRAGKSGISLF
jgi:hypothetical protein